MKKYFLSFFVIFFKFNIFTGNAVKPKYGPEFRPRAIPLYKSYEFFSKNRINQDMFWALISYYIPQHNQYSCSSAVTATVLNAARSILDRHSDEKVITEADLLEKVDLENWKENVSEFGKVDQKGLTLDSFQKVIKKSFEIYGFPQVKIHTVIVKDTTEKTKSDLIQELNKLSLKHFIIANFDQSIYTDDAVVGHYASIGSYDQESGRVLILDPDRTFYEPYWVSIDTFVLGMATQNPYDHKYRGYMIVDLN